MTDLKISADWITVEDALRRVLADVRALPAEEAPLLETLGRTLGVTLHSPIDVPPWDNSAMDGFAARSEDVRGATRASPRSLRVLEAVPAGGFPSLRVGPGQATRVMTGAPIPEGADCVVRVEHTREASPMEIEILDDLDAGRNIRPRGEDLSAGSVVLEAGHRVRAAEIAVLAAIGQARVPVHRCPRVAILATGDELVDLDAWDEVVAGRRIVNSNSYALAAATRATGAVPVLLGIARDDRASIAAHLDRARDADVLVTTAGASVGDHDVVKDALLDVGFELDFWRVRMRPGSPISFGRLPRPGQTPLPVFGLPGNPVSAFVTFEVFVRPVLRALAGRRDVFARTVTVRAGAHIESKRGLTHFLRVTIETSGGELRARLTGAQGSGLLSSLSSAQGLLVVPLDREAVEEGAAATAILLDPDDPGQMEPRYT